MIVVEQYNGSIHLWCKDHDANTHRNETLESVKFMKRIVWTYMVLLSSQEFQICMNDFITNNSFLDFYCTKSGIVKQRILSIKSLHKVHDQPTVITLLRL